MSRKPKYVGEKFGYLTVIEPTPIIYNGNRYAGYKCECVCGKTIVVKTPNLTLGKTKSCGCKKYELRNKTNAINGFTPGKHKRIRA